MIDVILAYPSSYVIAILLTLALAVETVVGVGAAWRIPYAVVLATVAAWYLIEPIYTVADFELFDPADVSTAFLSVIIFLVAFRIITPVLAPNVVVADDPDAAGTPISPYTARTLLFVSIALWLVLLAIGTWRVSGHVIEALFPNGRTEGVAMWTRGGVATGMGDTLVSVAAYLYLVALANFGILLVFVDRAALRLLCVVLIAISWPYAFLSGSRSLALTAFAPGFLAFLLYGRASRPTKVVVAVAAFLIINFGFKVIIAYRNIGFEHYGEVNLSKVQHYGLNMASELTNIVGFLRSGVLRLQWGYGYLADLAQIVPRAIWPNKPMIGFDYAIARGFASTSGDGTVSVTISQGMIGQAVRQFGAIAGPLATAIIMAGWVRILTRLRQSATVGRACLYLLGLGLTFNLGRDVSLLVLWPFVFAYVAVVAVEFVIARRRPAVMDVTSTAS